jgi:hypothetical protein
VLGPAGSAKNPLDDEDLAYYDVLVLAVGRAASNARRVAVAERAP